MEKQEAIQHFGNANRLAKALGLTRQAIYAWKEIPELHQYRLHRLTEGKLPLSPQFQQAGENE